MPERSLTRTARALLAFSNRVLTHIAASLITLLITPTVLLGLGQEMYGAWQVIREQMNFLSMGQFRPMGVLRLTLARTAATTDDLDKRRQVWAALQVWCMTIPLLTLFSGLLVYYAPRLIPVTEAHVPTVQLGLIIAGVVVVLTPLLNLPGSILQGLNSEYRSMGVQATGIILANLSIYGLVLLGFGLPAVLIGSALQITLVGTANFIIVRRHVPWFGISRPLPGMVRQFFMLNFWNLHAAFCRSIFKSGDLILIGFHFGPKSVTLYTLTRAIMDRIMEPLLQFFDAGLPGVGELLGSGQKERLVRLRGEMVRVLWFGLTLTGCGVILLNGAFLRLWVGEAFFGGQHLTQALVILTMTTAVSNLELMIVDSALRLREKAWALTLGAMVYLGGFFWLKSHLGLVAVALAQAVGTLLLIGLFWVVVAHTLDLTPSGLLRIYVRPVMVSGILLAVTSWLAPFVAKNWLFFLLNGFGVLLVVAPLAWFGILETSDRRRLGERLRSLLPRRKKMDQNV
ncbi:MAG: lipopolysaccharide biosynthesis protein [Magnetococcus sp. DMHC-1]